MLLTVFVATADAVLVLVVVAVWLTVVVVAGSRNVAAVVASVRVGENTVAVEVAVTITLV